MFSEVCVDKEQIMSLIDSGAYNYGPDQRDFFDDLVECFKLDPADPVTTRMYSLAWEYGHAGGIHEVFYYFKDLTQVFRGNYE